MLLLYICTNKRTYASDHRSEIASRLRRRSVLGRRVVCEEKVCTCAAWSVHRGVYDLPSATAGDLFPGIFPRKIGGIRRPFSLPRFHRIAATRKMQTTKIFGFALIFHESFNTNDLDNQSCISDQYLCMYVPILKSRNFCLCHLADIY